MTMERGSQGMLRVCKNPQMSEHGQPQLEIFEIRGSLHPLKLQLWFFNKFNTETFKVQKSNLLSSRFLLCKNLPAEAVL